MINKLNGESMIEYSLEDMLKLMVKYKIDDLECQGIKIHKSKHESQKIDQSNNKKVLSLSEEELALFSTSPNQMTLEMIDQLSVPNKKG